MKFKFLHLVVDPYPLNKVLIKKSGGNSKALWIKRGLMILEMDKNKFTFQGRISSMFNLSEFHTLKHTDSELRHSLCCSLQAALVLVVLILWWFYSLQGVRCRASPFPAASPATTWQVLSPTLNTSSPSSRCTRVVRRPHLCPLHPEVSDSTRGQAAWDL